MEGTCLVGGGVCSGLHLLPSDSVSDCFRLGCAGLCCLLASGHGFLGLWKPQVAGPSPSPQAPAHRTHTGTWEQHWKLKLPGF